MRGIRRLDSGVLLKLHPRIAQQPSLGQRLAKDSYGSTDNI
jgi:hypothetical protein